MYKREMIKLMLIKLFSSSIYISFFSVTLTIVLTIKNDRYHFLNSEILNSVSGIF